MITNKIRITPRETHYRIEDPQTGLCIRLHTVPAEPAEAPKIAARFTDGGTATWFPNWRSAAEAFARYLPGQPLNIVRVDA